MNITELTQILADIHFKLLNHTAKAINLAVTMRNWLYGYYLQEYELKGQDRAHYGEKVLADLAERLQSRDIPAASYRHLKLCRQFYRHYPQIGQTVFAQFKQIAPEKDWPQMGQTLSAPKNRNNDETIPSIPSEKLINALSYSHFVELMKVEAPLKRCFYELECIRGNWSVRELRRQIASLYYERSGLSKNKVQLSQITQQSAETQPVQSLIRDPYIFEFLGIKTHEVLLESKLANALLTKVQHFLLEMGKGFCFEARNKRILIGDEYFFIDLVMYHRILKLNVLIELKVGEFDHHHIGQLNTYINYYKKHEMHAGDNPPIGILLCTRKNNALVEYALSENSNQLFVSEYKLALPTKEEMKNFIETQLRNELMDLVDQEKNGH